jgi:DUF4097 and DUF4098 domain-containing protein YvlB
MQKSAAILSVYLVSAIAIALPGCKSSEPTSQQSGGSSPSGVVTINQMGGGIDVADAPHGASLATMGGDIHLGQVSSFANLKTMGGNITVDRANAPVEATTMAGKITITGATGSVHATTMTGDVWVRLSGSSASSGQNIELTSSSGAIELAVPKDFPMDVQVTLAYTKNAMRTYQIIDDMGLEHHSDIDWDNTKVPPQRAIHAAGRVGNGSNHVTIRTVNGDVIIKQAI